MIKEVRERKEVMFSELVSATERAGYNTTLTTLEMGSWGIPHLPGFTTLAHELAISQQDLSSLLHQCCKKLSLISLVPRLFRMARTNEIWTLLHIHSLETYMQCNMIMFEQNKSADSPALALYTPMNTVWVTLFVESAISQR